MYGFCLYVQNVTKIHRMRSVMMINRKQAGTNIL